MSEPKNFLARWSRRKRVADEAAARPAAKTLRATPSREGEAGGKPAAVAETQVPETPVFDPASLPSLDSIGAQTDISAFLKPGVPSDMKLAALRRAWSADPAIRDFKGLQENDWNFNDPNGIPGFGDLDPNFDVKKMLGDLFGDTARADEPVAEIPAPAKQLTPPSQQSVAPDGRDERGGTGGASDIGRISESAPAVPPMSKDMVHREENIATQNNDEKIRASQIKPRRSQGRALPE